MLIFIFISNRIHVRRTDKIGSEADFHKVDEYMQHAENYFSILDLRSGKKVARTVFIASDEASVLKEARTK